jgi:TonB-dependent SusC/RagA subfamily outer membrane receptor
MKINVYIVVLLLSPGALPLAAQERKSIPARIEEATLFFQGAELSHTATVELQGGGNEIVIGGLSPRLDVNSLKIKTTNGVVVSAKEFSVDYLVPGESSPLLQGLKDSIALHEARLEVVTVDIDVNEKTRTYLEEGIEKNVSGSEQGLSIDELTRAIAYYQAKLGDLEKGRVALLKERRRLEESLRKLRSQLTQESLKGNKTAGVLKLNLTSPTALTTRLTITYFTASAAWVPCYDIQIASTERPIAITARARVEQTTGFDWEKVKLSLSTATPSNGKEAPLFSAWYLSEILAKRAGDAALLSQNAYSYAQADKELSEVVVRGSGGVARDDRPLVIINGVVSSHEELEALDASMIKETTVLRDASATAIYGARAANGVLLVTLKSEMGDYVSETDNLMNVVYNIDLPYSIPGNGKVQNIDLQTREAPAEYKYYCAPKLDAETYLLAEIPGWEKLGLLSGTASITYDGTYIGESVINASSTREKLTLTLGTDKRVAVKREKMQDFSSTKLFGSDLLQLFTYTLTVKNNKTTPVNMVLKDQYPISPRQEFEVTLRKETTPWSFNKEETGVITWEERLAPGETKTYKISYSVKYPKGKHLNL